MIDKEVFDDYLGSISFLKGVILLPTTLTRNYKLV